MRAEDLIIEPCVGAVECYNGRSSLPEPEAAAASGIESLRCEDSNLSETLPQVSRLKVPLDARSLARPGVLFSWAAW